MTSFLTSKQSNFFGKRPQSCSKRHTHEFFCFPDLKNHFLLRFSRRSDLTQNGIVTPPHVPTRKPQNRPPFWPKFRLSRLQRGVYGSQRCNSCAPFFIVLLLLLLWFMLKILVLFLHFKRFFECRQKRPS